MEFVIGILLIILAVAISVLVMFQEGKDKKLSGAIAGGSDNFLSGIKGNGKDKLLSTLTAALSVVFAVLAVVLYVIVG